MSISAGAGTALAAGIGAVANMIGIGAGTAMTRKGIKLQHKNNLSAMQYQGELQDYYNKKYWDMYNSPEAQMRAMAKAGLNPYNNNIQSGGVNAQGVSALGSNVPDMGQGVREGMANVGNIASNAMSTYTQMQQTESMVQLQNAQSKEILDTLDFVIQKLDSEAKNNYKDVELKDAKKNAQLLYNTILSSSMNSQIEAYRLQNEYTRSQIALNNVNFDIQAKVSQYFDINQRMEIMKGISQLLNDESNRKLNDSQMKKLASDVIVNYANARKINIDARIAEETADAYISALKSQYTYDDNYWGFRNLDVQQDAEFDSLKKRADTFEVIRHGYYDSLKSVNDLNLTTLGAGALSGFSRDYLPSLIDWRIRQKH